MKKIGLILLCGFVLFGVCGCGKDNKNNLSGTYKIDVVDNSNEKTIEYLGTLKLFDNGTCTVSRESLVNGKHGDLIGDNEYNDCNYSVLDNTISIKYRTNEKQTYNNRECTIVDKGLKCNDLATINGRNDIWKKQ